MTNGHNGLQYSYAVWLENNTSAFWELTLAEAAAATKRAVFTAFLAWDGARYNIGPLCDRPRAALPSSQANGGPTTISRKAVQLINQSPQPEGRENRRNAAPLGDGEWKL